MIVFAYLEDLPRIEEIYQCRVIYRTERSIKRPAAYFVFPTKGAALIRGRRLYG